MSLYLTYSYSTKLSAIDMAEDNLKVKRNQEEATQRALFAAALYSAYCRISKAVHASDSVPNVGQGNPGSVPPAPGTQVAPAPFKPVLTEMQRGTYAGSATGSCRLALQTGNF